MAKPNVTLSLLHYEYEADCRANNKIPYSYRNYLRHYSRYAEKYKATLRIRRKPGEIMEVDWAGTTVFIVDQDNGWHSKLGNETIAEEILDRIIHDSYQILIDGEVSMREHHGLGDSI